MSICMCFEKKSEIAILRGLFRYERKVLRSSKYHHFVAHVTSSSLVVSISDLHLCNMVKKASQKRDFRKIRKKWKKNSKLLFHLNTPNRPNFGREAQKTYSRVI